MRVRERLAVWLLVGSVVLGMGCEARRELAVGLQTDFVPGIEFDDVRVELDGVEAARRAVDVDDSFARPTTLLERTDVAPGRRRIRVALLLDDTEIVRRTVEIPLRDRYLATVVITRSCREVSCPGPGDSADESSCSGGVCVRPDCGTEGAPACPDPQCSATRACEASSTSCVAPVCVEGLCLELPRVGACSAEEICVPGTGCVLRPSETPDAGVPLDAVIVECTTDAQCTAGACEDARCIDGACVATSRCAVGESCCGGGVCAVDCASATCAGQPAGTVCRAASEPCDAEERCDGTSPTCPPDGFAAPGTECRAAVDACDVAEQCNGAVPTCPSDGFAGVGTTCPGGVCNGLGACGPCSEGAVCSTGNVCERGELRCGSGAPVCAAAGPAAPATICRDAAGPCDVAETCNGGTSCPPDGFLSGATCQPAAGPCDMAETCDGTSAACPTDRRLMGVVCRAATGVCARDALCDGVSDACPANPLRSSGVCRVSSGTCDLAESCDGSSADCPGDARAPGGTECRASTGTCDPAEACDGSSASCPSNTFAGAGTPCMGGTCNGAGTCVASCGVVQDTYASGAMPFGVAMMDCRRAVVGLFGDTRMFVIDVADSIIGLVDVGVPTLNVTIDVSGTRAYAATADGRVAVVTLPAGPVTFLPAMVDMRWAAQNPASPADVWVLSTAGVRGIDATTGAPRFSVGVGFADPNGIAFDPATGDVYVSDRAMGVARFDAAGGLRAGPTMPCASPQALVWNTRLGRAHMACEGGEVVTLTPGLVVEDRDPVPGAFGLAISSDESMLAVTSPSMNRTHVYRIADGSVVMDFAGTTPRRVAFTDGDRFVVITSQASGIDVLRLP
jgi:hypothetical protein